MYFRWQNGPRKIDGSICACMAGKKGSLHVTGQCTEPRGFKRAEGCLLSAQITEKKKENDFLLV